MRDISETKTPESWFRVVESDVPVTQGDVLLSWPLLRWRNVSVAPDASPGNVVPTDSQERISASLRVESADVIVMTQACDLEHGKVSEVVVCPCLPLPEYKLLWEEKIRSQKGSPQPSPKAWRNLCNDITAGYMWSLFMLDSMTDGDLTSEHRIVDFHSIHTVPRSFLDELLALRGRRRLRLLPPYREHLSQSFARYFMRVGLPQSVKPDWE